ncbi:MAG TPA: hypothetical protein VH912_05020 [Streptosporangiaceae bacterium]|jgi:capsular polysaccharide biosynthesis protein
MDLLDSVRVLMKRWWLTLPLLALTLIGVIGTAIVMPWTYRSEATVVFLSSQLQSKQAGGNPWLAFDSSLTVTAEVVGREMMDERTAAGLRQQGNTAKYTVGIASDSTGPVLVIESEGAKPAVVQNTLKALLAQIRTRLDAIQTQGGVNPYARIRLSTVSASTEPQLMAKSKLQLLIMGLAVGLALTIGVPLTVESMVRRFRGVPSGPGGEEGEPPVGRPAERTLAAAATNGTNGRHRTETKEEEWTPYLPPERPRDPRRAGPRPNS